MGAGLCLVNAKHILLPFVRKLQAVLVVYIEQSMLLAQELLFKAIVFDWRSDQVAGRLAVKRLSTIMVGEPAIRV